MTNHALAQAAPNFVNGVTFPSQSARHREEARQGGLFGQSFDRIVRCWQKLSARNRAIRHLRELDYHCLRDIGLEPREIEAVVRQGKSRSGSA